MVRIAEEIPDCTAVFASVTLLQSERSPGAETLPMKRAKPRVGKTVKTAASSSPHRKASGKLRIPPILLEGDEPAPTVITGQEQKYCVGPGLAVKQAARGAGELPEAYGTGRLLVMARDPHCLYTHWDLTSAQQGRFNSLSIDGHLVLRVHREQAAGPTVAEVHVHPQAQHWFIDVPSAGTNLVVELGYYGRDRQWHSMTSSDPAMTPRATVSEQKAAQLATMPAGAPPLRTPPRVSWIPALGKDFSGIGGEVLECVSDAEVLALMQALEQLESVRSIHSGSEDWTLAQELALKGMLRTKSRAALSSVGLVRTAPSDS